MVMMTVEAGADDSRGSRLQNLPINQKHDFFADSS
jgi:hypothetical protein